jgi:spermidine synthase
VKPRLTALVAATLVLAAPVFLVPRWSTWSRAAQANRQHGEVIHETVSDYAHIRVRERGTRRSLLFVDPNGSERLQSSLDLQAPDRLELPYTRALFVSFLLQPSQPRVLVVGLGAGSMVRSLHDHLPDTQVDAVEIDPEVAAIAATWFGTRSGPRLAIHVADAFDYLRAPDGPTYDAIYMDAFLRPPAAADPALREKARRLKTTAFLWEVRSRLRDPGGLMAFNLIEREATTPTDLASIREVFPSVYVLAVAGTGNLAVLASTDPDRLPLGELRSRADRLAAEGPWAKEMRWHDLLDGLRDERASVEGPGLGSSP